MTISVTDSEGRLRTNPINLHDILSPTYHSYTGGAALDVFGLSAASTLAKLTPSASPGAASALLKSDDDGRLGLVGVRVGDGDVATPGMSFIGDTDSGWVRLGPDNIALVLGGAITHNFGAGASGGTFSMTRYTDTAPEAARVALRRAGGTYAAPTDVLDTWEIARITPTMYVNGAFREAALLRSQVVGTPGVGSYPLGWVFSTTADGSTARVDRFYIRPSGAIWVGTTPADVGANNLGVQGAYYQGSNQVVGARGAAVADATDAATAITQLNALLARVRAHGLIAT